MLLGSCPYYVLKSVAHSVSYHARRGPMSSPELQPSSPMLVTPPRTPPLTPSTPPLPVLRTLGSMEDEVKEAENLHECPVCARHFSLVRFKHRCKACNRKVCNDCSKSRLRLSDMGLVRRDKKGNVKPERGKKGARVCDPCARSYFATKMEMDPPNDVIAISPSIAPVSPQPRMNYSERRSKPRNLRLLRKRHFVVFGFFCFAVLLRVTVPCRNYQDVRVPWLLFGGETTHKLLCRIVRLDIFTVVLIALVLLDEYYRIRHQRKKHLGQKTIQTTIISMRDREQINAQELPPVIEINDSSNHSQLEQFCLDTLLQGLKDCTTSNEGVDVASYLDVCAETAKLLVMFGKATAFAASTVAGYMTAIDNSLSTNASLTQASPDSPGRWRSRKPTLQYVIDNEVTAGLASVGGKKNPSVSRGVLRLLWFLDFVEATLRLCFIESDVDEMGSSMAKAYETTLGARHPWLIRKGVMSALGSVPKRSIILKDIANGKPEAEAVGILQESQELMKQMIDQVRKILTEHELLDLK
ncbi:hypothetical protein THRCLA_04683 [Thraustotheca clavata]|uniref:FYVE-type domain-containing protein n=1 Tax=Thraustotheca clavata TaxID=74557 RepID=A0A1V9ZYC5_9STRA|nr:hypothetical protein THRCLA_04683 [Thraustotheca clavata]